MLHWITVIKIIHIFILLNILSYSNNTNFFILINLNVNFATKASNTVHIKKTAECCSFNIVELLICIRTWVNLNLYSRMLSLTCLTTQFPFGLGQPYSSSAGCWPFVPQPNFPLPKAGLALYYDFQGYKLHCFYWYIRYKFNKPRHSKPGNKEVCLFKFFSVKPVFFDKLFYL